MEGSPKPNTGRKTGERNVSGVAIRTLSVNEAIGDALRTWSAKFVARRIKTSTRTVEDWQRGKSGPQAKHFVAMLQDDELCAAVLTAIGRGDIATRAAMLAKLKEARDAIEGALE